ncbi:MAG TPA: TVP38/TMEM64 family protein [Thermodesulfobacteriota bacterium]|nr:TVP38/TMEM64 family protein [Thermodesulfobacteriota bacterium]
MRLEAAGGTPLRKSYLILLILGLVAVVVGGLVYLMIPGPRGGGDFFNGIELHGNIHRLKTLILSFGLWAPLISAFLMVAQSVVLFLPAFPIFVVNALVFGPFYGLLLSWSSAVTGSMACFSIAKTLGRPVVERFVKKDHLETADRALKKYEKYVILLFGFVPVVSFDVISYAAGLTLLAYWEFLLLVCIAQVPSALFYTLLVHRIDRGTLDVYWIVAAVLFFLLGFGSTAMRAYLNRRRQKESPESAP